MQTSPDYVEEEQDSSAPQPGTPVCWTVIGLSLLTYVLANEARAIPLELLVFSPAEGLVLPGILTHMVTHGSLSHMAFNMLSLYFLGTIVERRYASLNFTILFVVSGLIAAMAQIAYEPSSGLIGASGAISGVMAAFVRHYPFARLYIYGILPMPAWLLIILMLVYNIIGTGYSTANIAFVAHIAGMVAGLVLSLLLERPGQARRGF